MTKRTPVEQRFWAKVDKRSDDECWPWLGALDRDGYGSIGIPLGHRRSKLFKAHRFSYQLHYGIDPGDSVVMHLCDNPSCVNPRHLQLGTVTDNNRDMYSKGRGRKEFYAGADHPSTFITQVQASEIRRLYETQDVTQRELVQRFGLSKGTISLILKGKHWATEGQIDLVERLGRHKRRWRLTKRINSTA